MENRHLARMILSKGEEFPDQPALKWKEEGSWKTLTYDELSDRILKTASALEEMGISKGDRVAIFSANDPKWVISDFAILTLGAITVPIYATNTADQAAYIIEDSGCKVVMVGDREQFTGIHNHPGFEELKIISYEWEPIPESTRFEDLLEREMDPEQSNRIKKRVATFDTEDLATIIYTSGTTGEPKGAMLTHSNFYHQVDTVNTYFEVGPEDRSLCFLPLSHVFERAWSYFVFHQGAVNHYMEDHTLVRDYMEEVEPTVMVSVPRLFEKIYSTANEKLRKASFLKKIMFRWSMKVGKKFNTLKTEGRKPGPVLSARYRIADKLVLSKLRAIVGGDKKFFASGGAPLLKEIGEFFLSAGVLVCEGYGLTETSPIISFNRPTDIRFGTVGKTAPGVEIRFGDDNEIQVKGPNVMKGYWKKPELTEEAFIGGWFKTGDVGDLDENGFLRITDRLKDIIITSNGKNIARQRVEMVIGKDHYIEQILAIGNNRNFLSALVVPYYEALEEYAKEKGIPFTSREMLIKKKEIISFYNRRIEAVQKDLAHFEKIKKFTLLPEEFSQAAGEITPTLKNKRRLSLFSLSASLVM
jgi:long-chain acyl-CoA synthetase